MRQEKRPNFDRKQSDRSQNVSLDCPIYVLSNLLLTDVKPLKILMTLKRNVNYT